MKYLSLSLALLSLLGANSATAHDSGYVCQAVCSYERGNGRESIQLTTQNSDEQTAFEAIFSECKNLNGVLVGSPLDTKPNADAFCRLVWQ